MLDETRLRKKVLLRLLGHPLTLGPFVLGMTTLTFSLATNWQMGVGLFAGLAGCLVAGGTFLTRLVLQGESVARKVLNEQNRSEETARQRTLDELDRRLTTSDQDPRPETALRDLRALLKAFEEATATVRSFNAGSVVEIHAQVSQLFDHCVQSLERTEQLGETARRLQTPAARQPLLQQREKIVTDVQTTIQQLSSTLVALQTLAGGEGSPAELARLREELDQSLAVAKTVEERVNNLVRETTIRTPEQPHQP